jgi:hypothetical protein
VESIAHVLFVFINLAMKLWQQTHASSAFGTWGKFLQMIATENGWLRCGAARPSIYKLWQE